jgi:hypothetical protein
MHFLEKSAQKVRKKCAKSAQKVRKKCAKGLFRKKYVKKLKNPCHAV